MNAKRSIRTHPRLQAGRVMAGAALLVIMTWAMVLAAGTAQAADIGIQDESGILLAANDAHAADTAKKDDKASGGKEAAAKKDGKAEEKPHGIVGFLLDYLAKNPFAYLFLAIAIGYPLGRLTVASISLGTTAGTLVVGIAIALTSSAVFGITYEIPGLVEDIFLMMFMYALGMRVGPQFFSGLARGGLDFIVLGLIVCFANVLLVFFGAKLFGLAPGYAAGIISGSYTVTAVMGVAGSAVSSGAFKMPAGLTADMVGANMAAGYAISYVLSSIFTILFVKYLPSMFGFDPVKSAQEAEASFESGEDDGALPGTAGTSLLGFTGEQIRSYKVEHEELVGKSVQDLFHEHPHAFILKVVRGDEVIDAHDNPTLQMGDVIGIMGNYGALIGKGNEAVGTEIDEPKARIVDIEVADLHIGKTEYAGKTLEALGREIGFGVYLKSMFRAGVAIPHQSKTVVEKGDVLRLAGPAWCVNQAAKALKSVPHVESAYTEVSFMAVALLVGFVIGHASVKIGGIPFALGTSAGCMLMGIFVSWLRTRNPDFGGPTSEGARAFLNDIGLSMFVAVLAAGVGPKIMASFQGTVVIWIALLGLIGALVPPFLAWLYGLYFRKMNPIILAGACAGGRNSTPTLNGVQDISQSAICAVAYPVPYALTSCLVLILSYLVMVFS